MRLEQPARKLFEDSRHVATAKQVNQEANADTVNVQFPDDQDPAMVLLTTLGILDECCYTENKGQEIGRQQQQQLLLAAKYFHSRQELEEDSAARARLARYAAVGYYICGKPGTSKVVIRDALRFESRTQVEKVIDWLLSGMENDPDLPAEGSHETRIVNCVNEVVSDSTGGERAEESASELALYALQSGTSADQFTAEMMRCIVRRVVRSATLAVVRKYWNGPISEWRKLARNPQFPKTLWPAQLEMCRSGVLNGKSMCVQVGTSAGKTRLISLAIFANYLRSGGRYSLVIAPFRALCDEIQQSLESFFRGISSINVVAAIDDLTFLEFDSTLSRLDEHSNGPISDTHSVLVMTPEKCQYLLRASHAWLANCSLVAVDEAHLFDDPARGPLYENLLHELRDFWPANVQAILLSAIATNVEEVASWYDDVEMLSLKLSSLAGQDRSFSFLRPGADGKEIVYAHDSDPLRISFTIDLGIERQLLKPLPRERAARRFPSDKEPEMWRDYVISLASALSNSGAVAVFEPRPASVLATARRVIELHKREAKLRWPTNGVNNSNMERLKMLIGEHYGVSSVEYDVATKGYFVHHGLVEPSVRRAIEYALTEGQVPAVICTSTLAQGINMPFRHLIVRSVHPAQKRMKVRDFGNLIGRVGREGMHAEGNVCFAGSQFIDGGGEINWGVVGRVISSPPEPVSSSILTLAQGFTAFTDAYQFSLSAEDLIEAITSGRSIDITAFGAARNDKVQTEIDNELNSRRLAYEVVVGRLLSFRSVLSDAEFREESLRICTESWAYHLASSEERDRLRFVYLTAVKSIIDSGLAPDRATGYSTTLLPVQDCISLDHWLDGKLERLLEAESVEGLFSLISPEFVRMVGTCGVVERDDTDVSLAMTSMWIEGRPVKDIRAFASSCCELERSRPAGHSEIEKTDKYLINSLSYKGALAVSGIGVLAENALGSDFSESGLDSLFAELSGRLRYGVGGLVALWLRRRGVIDRLLCGKIARIIAPAVGGSYRSLNYALDLYSQEVAELLDSYPAGLVSDKVFSGR